MAATAVQQAQAPPAFAHSVGLVTERLPKSSPRSPHDVVAVLNYHKPNEDGSPPNATYVDRPETYDRPVEAHKVNIHDISGRESEYSLDGNGFQIHRHTENEREFLDDEQIKSSYYLEVEQLLKDVTGASRIFIFDHTIRRQPPGSESAGRTLRGPVQRVHIDQSYSASLSRVPHHLPGEAERLLQGRVQIINVWRPIKTIHRDPLAVADAKSVPDSDLIPIPLIYPSRRGETYGVKHNTSHHWVYKRGLTPDEVLLIKCFDSKVDGRARRVPHTAFVDSSVSAESPARESIEVRCLVFHENDRD
ncbi:hypothetical protein F5X68DRAFT_227020 [Plectosphaerella plurivora]|uniref:Methyltransferase n=1 Tax=Plectosphaerella plurivora TaxID=936078 RepID=A0A9P8VK59_9PEZI|nr:hypothetical protein F5X68DRAFT_227020 [Plectosphaerella plurivora]